MAHFSRTKRVLRAAMVLCVGLALAGCATVPPQIIAGYPTAAEPTATPGETGAAVQTADQPIETPPSASPAPAAVQSGVQAQGAGEPPQKVEVFYSGMPSLMGFADASQTTIYETAMDALPACVSLVWPEAAASYYRYGADVEKSAMRLSKDQVLSRIGDPSFYLDEAMTRQPNRVKFEGWPVTTEPQNMNEPIQGFYEAMSLPAPAPLSGTRGTQVAVAASDPEQLTLIVTDLHELRADDGALLSALNEKVLKAGKAIGVAAVMSEFSGYVPGLGENKTSFVWGSPPTGTLDYVLDYGDYRVGVSVDPEQRKLSPRPFYVLVAGEQSAVTQYLAAFKDRLTQELSSNQTFRMDTAVFGSGYVPAGYTLPGHMRYLAGQGVTAVPEPSAPAGVARIELKASQQARFLEWEVAYQVHPADPRGLNLAAEDFTFITQAVTESGASTVLPNLSWSVVSAAGDTVMLKLRLDLPQGILPKGDYQLHILGSLTAPSKLPGSDWLSTYGQDIDGAQLFDMEQNTLAFDGGRTLFLSRLIDTLGKANIGRLGVSPLGTAIVALTVYA